MIFESASACGGEGEYYSNARWYDPTLGRFLTEDPARDGINWFAYCSNNPLAYIDPTGMVGATTDDVLQEGNEEERLLFGPGGGPGGGGGPELGGAGAAEFGEVGGAPNPVEIAPKVGPQEGTPGTAQAPIGEQNLETVRPSTTEPRIAAGPVKPYETGPAGDLAKRSKNDNLDIDHQPSKASLFERAEAERVRPLTQAEKQEVADKGMAAAVPKDVHRSDSPTYGGRNTPAQIEKDAADPVAAAKRDSAAMVKAAAPGDKAAAIKAMKKIVDAASGK